MGGVGGFFYSRIDSRCSAGCAGSSLCLPARPGGPELGGGAGSPGPLSTTSCPATGSLLTQYASWYLLRTHLRPVEIPAWVVGKAHTIPRPGMQKLLPLH